jgi:hypothetical protein
MSTADHDRPAKRQRVTQACQRCRSRKLRCDGRSPSCGACLTAQATCLYDNTSGRQRGLRSGYVKVLESLWGSVFQNVPGSERVVSQLLAGLPANAGTTADDAGGDDASPLERWRVSSIPEAIRALLDGKPINVLEDPGAANTTWSLPSTSGADNVEQHDLHAHALPPTSNLDDVERPRLQNVERRDLDAPSLPSEPTHAANPSCFLAPGLPDLPQDWQTLVQVYLCTEYCCLPIFEKACPYRWAYKYQDHAGINLCNLNSSSRGQYASLWAILVLGELHLHGANSARLDQIKQSAKVFLATAESSGPDRAFSYAFLLWALVYTGTCAYTLARMMLAQAMVLVDLREELMEAQAKEGETLVHAGCFVLETILAFTCGAQTSTITVDFDELPTNDVGEWDPFINILEPMTASNMPPQLPPSRTASTFKALAKLMAILRRTKDSYDSPDLLAAEFHAWEVSLPTDLRGALRAEAAPSRTPVPSQLNLQAWYGTLYGTIARLRQEATGSANYDSASDPPLRGIHALHSTECAYGLSMLPATSIISLLKLSQHSTTTSSPPLSPGGTLLVTHNHLTTRFLDHWGWSNLNRGEQQDLAGKAAQGPHINTHQPAIPPSLTEGPTSSTTGLERQEPALACLQYHADAATESSMQSGLQAIGDTDGTQPALQWPPTDLAPAPSVNDATATILNSFMEDPASYDLLEYLTIFENNNGYVVKFCYFNPSPVNDRLLITNAVTIQSIWNLWGT